VTVLRLFGLILELLARAARAQSSVTASAPASVKPLSVVSPPPGTFEKPARDIAAKVVLLGSDRQQPAGPFEGELHVGECS